MVGCLISTSVAIGENKIDDEDSNDSKGEFCEIMTSKGEPYETSDEEDAKFFQLASESAYACLPLKNARKPTKLLSYLFLDKDSMFEDDIDDLDNYLLSQLEVANYAFF